MSSETVFECLLISQNVDVLRTISRLLELLSIQTRVCMTHWRALELLSNTQADMVVLDCEHEEKSSDLLQQIWSAESRRKPTIVAIAKTPKNIPGVHVVIAKPVSVETAARSLGLAYAQMLYEHRQNARFALNIPVIAINQSNRPLAVTVSDVGKQGIGLRSTAPLQLSDRLQFDVLLPDARKSVHVEARVVWSRPDENGKDFVAGCEFVRLPPVDVDVLDEWCRNQCKVKSPAVEATVPTPFLEQWP